MSSMDYGGAETFLMKQYRALDRERYQMDFCVNVPRRCDYDDEIESLGGKVHRLPPKSSDFMGSLSGLKRLVREHGYKNVLVNSIKPGTSLELLAARAGGAERLIYRSTSSAISGGAAQKFLHSTLGLLAHSVPDVKIAPSTVAAEFCFGKKSVMSGEVTILPNAIDTDLFSFVESIRDSVRKDLGLGTAFAFLHIGRFVPVKNHPFIIDLFKDAVDKHPDSVLILVGSGGSEKDVRKRVSDAGLGDRVIFTGRRDDVNRLMNAADVLLLPSFHEGMPNTVIEAQACSLPCVVSENVTREAAITPLVSFLPLGNSEKWAKACLDFEHFPRRDMRADITAAGYDIRSVSNRFVELCFGCENER